VALQTQIQCPARIHIERVGRLHDAQTTCSQPGRRSTAPGACVKASSVPIAPLWPQWAHTVGLAVISTANNHNASRNVGRWIGASCPWCFRRVRL
jgi:hypothetical protein